MTRFQFLMLGCVLGALLAGGSAAAAPPGAATGRDPAGLAGRYDGGQMEIAAGLELGADGRFRYALSYGALDEEAAGRWTADGATGVRLTSDPVATPRIVLVAAGPSRRPGRIHLALDLLRGMDRQYFDARLRLADGRWIERQFAEDGLDVPLKPGERVAAVVLLLPVFGLESQPFAMPRAGAGQAHFRFDANDLGKVAFAGERLASEPGGLRLERYGRSILFRKLPGQ